MVHIISPSLLKQMEELDVNLKFVVKVGVLLVRHLLLGFFMQLRHLISVSYIKQNYS